MEFYGYLSLLTSFLFVDDIEKNCDTMGMDIRVVDGCLMHSIELLVGDISISCE